MAEVGTQTLMKRLSRESREDARDECTCEHLWSRHLTWTSSWVSKEKSNWGVYLPYDRVHNTKTMLI